MSYYKITYESDTIEGLRAIQGSVSDQGASAGDSSTFETQVPPPPSEDEAGADALSDAVSAPPMGNGTDANFSDDTSSSPPPPLATDSAATDAGTEEGVQPPPMGESQDRNDDDRPVPPQQSAPKGSGK